MPSLLRDPEPMTNHPARRHLTGLLLAAIGCASFSEPTGHYVLVVEGTVKELRISGAVAKDTPAGGPAKPKPSEFRLSVRDQAGKELANVPVDLSAFDLDPANIGKPPKVTGCIVRSSRIGVLLNVPNFAEAAEYVILRGETRLGGLDAAGLRALLAGGAK